MRIGTLLALALGSLLSTAAPTALAADALTEEVFRNEQERTLDEKVYGEPSHEVWSRNVEDREGGSSEERAENVPSAPPSAPGSPGWPPDRSAPPEQATDRSLNPADVPAPPSQGSRPPGASD